MWVGFLGWGDPLVIGNDNQLQDSYLENPMGREAGWTPVHGVVKSRTRLSTHSLIELATILLLFYVLGFWPSGMRDLSPQPGIESLVAPTSESQVPRTGPPGNSLGPAVF